MTAAGSLRPIADIALSSHAAALVGGMAVFRLLRLSPPHGWRAVWWELGIVTLGVLVALAAQQLVEDFHNRRVARETRDALRDEIEDNLVSVQLRSTAARCVDRRLREVRQLLDEWGRSGTFERPLWIAQAPRLTLGFSRFDAALSAGRLALLPREEQYRLGEIVTGLRGFQATQDAEFLVWPKLRALEAGADVLSPGDRTMIRMALQEALYHNYSAKLTSRQLLPAAAEFGFRPDQRRFNRTVRRIWKNGRYTPAICAPIDTPPGEANRMTQQVTPLPQ